MRAGRFRAGLAAYLALTTGFLLSFPLRASEDTSSSKAALLQHAQAALAALPLHYALSLHTHRDGGDFHAWQRFVAVSTLADYERASGDDRFFHLAQSLLADRRGLDGNDDSLWVAEADLDLAPLMKDRLSQRRTLQDAETLFGQIAAQYWDGSCGGGVWWDHARTYKNAITNELFLDVAARLYTMTGNAAYRNRAEQSWRWFSASGMISPTYAVNDGLDKMCHNNGGPPYSYNQGVILDALLHLAASADKKTLLEDAAHIADEALTTRTQHDNGFVEAQTPMTVDSQIFRGIFVRAVGYLVLALPQGPERARFSSWLQAESHALWANRFQTAHFNATWDKVPRASSAQAQITAANLFIAAANLQGDTTP